MLDNAPRSANPDGMSDLQGSDSLAPPERKTGRREKPARPPLWKVILLNDDFTPREFVVRVLSAVFRMNADEAMGVMLTAHQKGACVVAVFTREVAEEKARKASDMGARAGYPLTFTTEKDG
ncbi:MAG: ATP-dependent Clp protease adaptor ClpS [Pseudomonadota bacterium]